MNAFFIIPGRLPGLNEIILKARGNRFSGAHQKKKYTQLCAQYVISGFVPTFTKPVNLKFGWCEPNRRRDVDNIQAGAKFVLDALVLTERIPDDSQKWVKAISHTMLPPEKATPHVAVEITEVEEEV